MQRIRPTLVALCFAVVMLIAFAGVSYHTGLSIGGTSRFLSSERPPSVSECVTTFPIEYAMHSTEANDVIFLGDSACRHDVDPSAFEKLTGLKAYNLGTVGAAGQQTLLLTARAYLANHPKPRAIVICMTPVSFAPREVKDGDKLPLRFAESYGENCPLKAVVRAGAVNTLSGVRSRLFHQIMDVRELPLVDMHSETYLTLQSRLARDRGFWSLSGHGPQVPVPWFGQPIIPSKGWDAALLELASHAPVIVRLTPLRQDLRDSRDFVSLERWVASIARRSSVITIGQPFCLYFDAELCWDHAHLNSAGVEKLMPILAADVQGVLRAHGKR